MKFTYKLSLFLTALLFGGCTATFEPRLISSDLTDPRLPTVKEVQGGLEVSIEEFASPHKSRKAFDAELASNRILPLLVRVENKGTKNYKVRRNQVSAFQNGQILSPLYGFDAAHQGARRGYAWNALVNTAATGPLAMFFWPASMAGSASQARTINRRIEHHFENLELSDKLLKPDETVAGFVFFKAQDQKDAIENLAVEMIIEADGYEGEGGEPLKYKFSLPTINLHAPISGQAVDGVE